jgi:hypothetical protein
MDAHIVTGDGRHWNKMEFELHETNQVFNFAVGEE